MDDTVKQNVRKSFAGAVNMAPAEIEKWLQTENNKKVGWPKDHSRKEPVGHHSGRRIVEIKRKAVTDLTDADYQHMQKVVGFVHRHLAQRPEGDIADTPWRYSLMNWGHDPK